MDKKILLESKNFQITKENINGLILFSINNILNNNKISIIKNYGASIKELIFNKNNKSYNIVPSFNNIILMIIKKINLTLTLFYSLSPIGSIIENMNLIM